MFSIRSSGIAKPIPGAVAGKYGGIGLEQIRKNDFVVIDEGAADSAQHTHCDSSVESIGISHSNRGLPQHHVPRMDPFNGFENPLRSMNLQQSNIIFDIFSKGPSPECYSIVQCHFDLRRTADDMSAGDNQSRRINDASASDGVALILTPF